MKVFWVLGYDRYYPCGDNFQASFETREEAENYVDIEKRGAWPCDFYDIIDITDRL